MARDNDVDGAAAKIWLTRKEQRLRESLDQGDMPVLGLYIDHFSPDDREYFRAKVLGSADPVRSFIRGLQRWPATFATFLTVHLVEGYGQSGNAEVYPYIQTALGIGEKRLGPKERERLANEYRRACVTLGLSIAPSGKSGRSLVDEYLRQVGVPVPYFRGLFEGLAKVARRFGVPDKDDPNDLVAWQGYVDIPSTRPVLRRAVENDSEGYYAGLFFRVGEFENESECDNAIERAGFEAYKELGQVVSKRKALIPSLSWRDDELGILLPSGDDTRWLIKIVGVDGESSSIPHVQGGVDPRFIPVGTRLVNQCEVSSGALHFVFPVWESVADNQLVLFDRSGKFAARGRLGGDSIFLNPGTYTMVSRWRPLELGDASHPLSEEVELFGSQLELVAGQTVDLARGPANLQVVARSVPSLSWEGPRLVGMTGKEIYWGSDLAIRVSIPSEILEIAAQGFELIASQPDGKERVIPLSADLEGSVDVPVAASVLELGSGIQRVRIRLRRPDIPNRALATITGFVWPEIVAVDVGRLTGDSAAAFENFDLRASDNVTLEGNSLTYSDETQRFYRTVFKVGSENVAFQWPVPGVFVALEEAKEGAILERPIEKRGVVQVRPSSRQWLKVYSASDGVLRLGLFSQEIKSALFGGTQIYLSNLVEFLSPEDHTLRLEIPSTKHSEELVRLVTPHQVLGFVSTRSGETYTLDFCVTGELTELSIDALDLLSGKRHEFRAEADAVSLSGNPFQRASLTTSQEGRTTSAKLTIPLIDWTDGLWVLQLQARIDGRWGKLVNARGDVYAGGLRVPLYNNARAYLKETPTQQGIHVFGRLVDALLECYSLESWNDLKWFDGEWQSVSEDLASRLDTHAHALLSMAFRRTPETSAESWVPVKSVAAQLTEIFALPFSIYNGFNGSTPTTNSVFGAGKIGAGRDDELFREQFFSVFLMFGFENRGQVATGRAAHLRGFSSRNLAQVAPMVGESERRRVLASMEWMPTGGNLLGIRHYWWALQRLRVAFHAAEIQNDFRKGNTLRLASRVCLLGPGGIHPELSDTSVSGLRSLGLLDPWADQESDSQDRENLENIVEVIAVLALGARLHARRPGLLSEIKQNLCRQVDLNEEQLNAVLGFILYIGADLFVFYLGLWEFALCRDYDKEG